MFTLGQIANAHTRVKTHGHFPDYINDLILLGVRGYDTFVEDGHTSFNGRGKFKVESSPKYNALNVSSKADSEKFQKIRWDYQQGKINYETFCQLAARNGVEKWRVDTLKMTCTYFDRAGDVLLVEKIPS